MVGRGLRDQGKSWFRIGREMGLPGEMARRVSEQTSRGFAPVEVVDSAPPARVLGVVAPSGYWVEGLDVATAVALLTRLS